MTIVIFIGFGEWIDIMWMDKMGICVSLVRVPVKVEVQVKA